MTLRWELIHISQQTSRNPIKGTQQLSTCSVTQSEVCDSSAMSSSLVSRSVSVPRRVCFMVMKGAFNKPPTTDFKNAKSPIKGRIEWSLLFCGHFKNNGLESERHKGRELLSRRERNYVHETLIIGRNISIKLRIGKSSSEVRALFIQGFDEWSLGNKQMTEGVRACKGGSPRWRFWGHSLCILI